MGELLIKVPAQNLCFFGENFLQEVFPKPLSRTFNAFLINCFFNVLPKYGSCSRRNQGPLTLISLPINIHSLDLFFDKSYFLFFKRSTSCTREPILLF